MSKVEKMIEKRKDDSAEKTKIATEQIKNMVEANEPVNVKELVCRTGLSRAFFYANEVVHEALLKAQEQQEKKRRQKRQKENLDKPKVKPRPQKDAAEQMKEQQLVFLEQQNEKLRMEAALLRWENQDLKELIREQEEQLCQYL